MSDPRDPHNPEEWQEAANLASMHLQLLSAKQWGLVEGGPGIDEVRCEEVLSRALERGIQPTWGSEELQALLAAYAAEELTEDVRSEETT